MIRFRYAAHLHIPDHPGTAYIDPRRVFGAVGTTAGQQFTHAAGAAKRYPAANAAQRHTSRPNRLPHPGGAPQHALQLER